MVCLRSLKIHVLDILGNFEHVSFCPFTLSLSLSLSIRLRLNRSHLGFTFTRGHVRATFSMTYIMPGAIHIDIATGLKAVTTRLEAIRY